MNGRALLARALAVAVLFGGASGCGTRAGVLDVENVYARTVSARTAQTAVDLDIAAPRAGTYITAQGAVDLGAPGFALAVQEAGINLKELLLGDRLYLRVPASAQATNGGKAWAEFVLSTGAAAGGTVLAGPLLAGSVLMAVDPAPDLDLLRAAPASTTMLGPRVLDGVRATEYRLDYSTTELASVPRSGALTAGSVSLLAQIAHPRPARVPVYVWLDSRGRLVELKMSVVLGTEPRAPSPAQAALANQLPTTLSVNVYLGHFGERVALVPPAAGRTNELPRSELEGGTL
ncbi:MAG: hypothetical protein ACLQVK_16110 [Acidimicrobiales bacterium]